MPDDYVMMGIDISGLTSAMPTTPSLMGDITETQAFGDAWLTGKTSPAIGVPSILAPRGMNYLINPLHPDANGAIIAEITDFQFDGRLWKKADPT
jgi:RES domain-containing protein